ncbi:MAG: methionine biosynthesis protein MetW [Pseudomonadota bacterium]
MSAELRPDLAHIAGWIRPQSNVLDLGCGDGALLAHLATHGVRGYGLEIDPDNIARCLRRGVNVIEADVDEGLREFSDGSFDYVVMNQALQAMQRPDRVVSEMLRVGRTAIITFPNFGHWRVRLALAAGRMPVTPALPETWFNTPNIHLCTVADFEDLCQKQGWRVLQRSLLNHQLRDGFLTQLAPNLFSEVALYMLGTPPA